MSLPAQPPAPAAPLNRRQWMGAAFAGALAVTLAGVAPLLAASPPVRNGKSHMKLSLAAYSFNRILLKNWLPEQITGAKFTLEQFIDFCAEQQLDGTELTSYYFPKDPNDDYLVSLKERTFRLGLDVSGTAIGNDFCVVDGDARKKQLDDCRAWIDRAAVLGGFPSSASSRATSPRAILKTPPANAVSTASTRPSITPPNGASSWPSKTTAASPPPRSSS